MSQEVGLNNNKKALTFTVDASLLLELGERLVAKRSIALSELIKNSYDADATDVELIFQNVTQSDGSIIVRDNGTGMSLSDIQNYWMRIATTHKAADSFSPVFRRAKTGAKGVGRFAARRIAKQLRIHSVAQLDSGTWEETIVEIDWDRFVPGTDLTSIETTCWHTLHRTKVDTGVTLTLSRLQEAWTKDDIDAVFKDIQHLVPPFPSSALLLDLGANTITTNVEGFRISVVAPEFPEYEGDVFEKFYSNALARLVAWVDSDGSPEYRLTFRGKNIERKLKPNQALFPNLAGAALIIHYFVYKSKELSGSGFSTREAQRLGRDYGGVKIYQDGFRVFPYGDPGDDWLGLDAQRAGRQQGLHPLLRNLLDRDDRRAGLRLPGNNQLFGAVFVSRNLHPDLQPNISRERLLETLPFHQLQQFTRIGIDWMTVERAAIPEDDTPDSDDRKGDSDQSKSPMHQFHVTLAQIKAEIRTLPSTVDTKEIEKSLDKLQKIVELQDAEHISKLGMLRILASAGTTIVIFNHHIRSIIDGLRGLVHDLQNTDLLETAEAWPNAALIGSRFKEWLSILEAQATQLGFLLGPSGRKRRRRLNLRPIVQQVIKTFKLYSDQHGIDIENNVPPTLITPPFFEAELHSIFLNILSNSLKAVKEQPVRRICIEGDSSNGDLLIVVRDTGVGVPRSERIRVFQPFVTTSVPDPVLGIGTGLGLAIVHDIITEHRGKVRFVEPNSFWSTVLEISIPKGVDDSGL